MKFRTVNIEVSQYDGHQTKIKIFSGYEARRVFVLPKERYAEKVFQKIQEATDKGMDLILARRRGRTELHFSSGRRLVKRLSKCVVTLPPNTFARYTDSKEEEEFWGNEWHLHKMALAKDSMNLLKASLY